MAWFKALAPRVGGFDKLGCKLYAISADEPAMLRKLSQSCGVQSLCFLSDREARTAELLNLPLSTHHPMSRKYPKGFIQPGFFLYGRDGELVWEWRQTPKLRNLFGARNRPSPEDLLVRVRQAAAELAPPHPSVSA